MKPASTPSPDSPVTGLDSVRAAEAMRAGVVTCPPTTPLDEVAATMAALRLDSIVVIDDDLPEPGWGTVSVLDIVAAASVRALADQIAIASAVMPPVTVPADATLRRAAEIMTARNALHLFVTDSGSDRPVGILSALDIAAALDLSKHD